MVRTAIEQLAARRPPAEDVPDIRTTEQRHADALIELCERARTGEQATATAGEPPHLTVTIDWDAPRTALGSTTLDHTWLMGAAAARRLACECKLIPVVSGSDSEPLDVGRATRTVTPGSSPRSDRPRPWLQLPRVPPATIVVRGPPRAALG
jgi:hypothetical protein